MPTSRMLRAAASAGALAAGVAVMFSAAASADKVPAGQFAPAAPAGVVLEKAKGMHRKAAVELDNDPEYAAKMLWQIAEWVHVQEFRADKGLSAWAKKTSTLYAEAASAAVDDKAKAAAKTAAAGKAWADYEKNAKAWGDAKPAPGKHKRMSEDLDFIMAFHKEAAAQGTGTIDRAIRKGDLKPVHEDLLLLAEFGNMLVSDRADPKWKQYAANLRHASLHMIEVGEKGDSVALKPALNEIQKACNDCHGGFRKK